MGSFPISRYTFLISENPSEMILELTGVVDFISGSAEKVIWAKPAHQIPTSRKVMRGARKGLLVRVSTNINPMICK